MQAALAPPLQPAGPHGLPLLPSGEHLTLDAPGWTRGIGTGGRVWPGVRRALPLPRPDGHRQRQGRPRTRLRHRRDGPALRCSFKRVVRDLGRKEESEGLLQLARQRRGRVEFKQ